MIWWTGLAPWEFEFPFPGSLISTFLVAAWPRKARREFHWRTSQFWTLFLELCQQRAQKARKKRAFLELFVDTGAKKRGPEMGASLTGVFQVRSWSHWCGLGAIWCEGVAES